MSNKRYMGTDADQKKVQNLLKKEKLGWRKERLIALKMGFKSENHLEHIAEVIGRDRATIQRWFQRFRKGGIQAVMKRGRSSGRPSICEEAVFEYLEKGLRTGRWNTAKEVQRQLEEEFGLIVHYQNVWRWLKKCAGVLRVPRPEHEKRDSNESEHFKRSFYGKLKDLPLPKDKPLKIWFADESRYGLLPKRRRCWTLKGLGPKMPYQTRYEWSYCYGALDVVAGKAVFFQTPSVNLDWTEAFLQQIKDQYPEHEHVVVWDGAGFHPKLSTHQKVPEGMYIIMLPAYSPELNPIEKLWDCIQDYTCNKIFSTIEELDQVVSGLLKEWWEHPRKVISLVGKNWHRLSANAFAKSIMRI